jgi:hypothetical protein
MIIRTALVVGAFGISLGCGNKPTLPPAPEKKDGGPADAEVAIELPAAQLGLVDVSAYGWRKRAGQPAFRLARKAEARDAWGDVVATCRQVLAADPGHLEAAWLLAVGLAKLGKLDQVLEPLQKAAAGDFAKWGPASLELPALQAFLATPVGVAWRRRVEQDRERYGAAIARAVIVTAGGDLYAYTPPPDPAGGPAPRSTGGAGRGSSSVGEPDEANETKETPSPGRWYRLSHAGGVVGAVAVPAAQKIAYVSRIVRSGKRELGLGVIDLVRGRTSRPIRIDSAAGLARPGDPAELLAAGSIAVAYSAASPAGFWIGSGASRAMAWRRLDDDFRLHALPARTSRPAGPWLEVTTRATARLHALPDNLTADWDDQSLASAMRIGTSNRVVSVASPGLIDGNTAAWSPDRAHVAFVAQLDDHCADGALNTAAFIADASTGATRELERAAGGIAVVWLAERKLVIAGDHGVTIRSLDDGIAAITIEGATGLMIPRERPRCAPVEPTDTPVEDPDPTEPAASVSSDEPVDAGVADAR